MTDEITEYTKLADEYYRLELEDRSLGGLQRVLTAAVNAIRSKPRDNELFEGVNLEIQLLVGMPDSNKMQAYLSEVYDDLLLWEDIEAVLRTSGASNIKEVAVKKRLAWCGYIDEVIADISK